MSLPLVNPNQERAHAALQDLLSLGLNQKDIASRLGGSGPSMVSHINGIYKHPDFHVSEKTALALEALVVTVRLEKAKAVLEGWPLVVLETCNCQGAVVDSGVRNSIRDAILSGLATAALSESAFEFDLPGEIAGALAKIGPDAWILVRKRLSETDTPAVSESRARAGIDRLEAEIESLQVAIHEMQHLIDHLRSELPATDALRIPKAAY